MLSSSALMAALIALITSSALTKHRQNISKGSSFTMGALAKASKNKYFLRTIHCYNKYMLFESEQNYLTVGREGV